MKNSTIIAIALLTTLGLGGCATHQVVRPAPAKTAALTACDRSVSLPPELDGAARTGTGQQPVLVVGNGACQSP